jgi:hypothetical protein
MEQRANRVLNAVKQWVDMENDMQHYFSSRQLSTKDKLAHYDRIVARFGKTQDVAEKIALNKVRSEIELMEGQLYPLSANPTRLGKRLARFINGLRNDRSWERETTLLKQRLPEQLLQGGYSGVVKKVEKQLDLGYRSFDIKEHAYLSENRIAHLNFRYGPSLAGPTRLATVEVVFPDIKQPQKDIRFSYDVAEIGLLDVRQLRNLASGRVVAISGNDMFQSAATTYVEMVNGELRTVSARAQIPQQLSEMPFKELQGPDQQQKVQVQLQRGDQVEVTHAYSQQRYFLHISKESHKVEILDAAGKKVSEKSISVEATLNNIKEKSVSASLQQKQHPVFGKQKGLEKPNQQVAL